MEDASRAGNASEGKPKRDDAKRRRLRRPWVLWALLGALLMWLAMEPLAWWPLGWVALVPWSLLALSSSSPSRREYRWLWLAGSLFWLVALYGLCFAHPAMFLGWFTLSVYLGVYAPLFVGLVRVAHRNRVPAVLAIPIVWVGLELIRGYAFTGFSACMLGHTQADVAILIQVTDLFGSYAVSFVVAAVAAAIAIGLRRYLPQRWQLPVEQPPATPEVAAPKSAADSAFAGMAFAAVLLLATLGYGAWRLGQPEATAKAESLGVTIALIQRNEAVEYIMPSERGAEIFASYLRGSQEAMAAAGPQRVDLVVWPESMFSRGMPWMDLGDQPVAPAEAGLSQEEFLNRVQVNAEVWQQNADEVQRRLVLSGSQSSPPSLLVGSGAMRFEQRPQQYSGAVFVGSRGRVDDWYGKQHLVMFGEYIPFMEWFPSLYTWLPLPRVTPGAEAKVFPLADTQIAPNICFETAVECATIDQVRRLAATGTPPDMIINLTNDAWFGGSPVLDHHRRCSQFAAVSTRRPLLMASNTGPTIWVDGSGRLVEQLPKSSDGHILAQPTRDGRWGLYQTCGDWPVRALGAIVVVLAAVGFVQRRKVSQRSSSS
ncbi:apolipoprotein N-acyltransferase [Roseimaritima ulvae]|uniref:Apolipoprotein N-acyltransferase n=1 Tax=Roseimaritima ulvae TaxID=980254 RepID=A0A5B9QH01_9BACT|nr:apolipoprotein N-acyltransferase [Roseimaritima ulvae]QEG38387.1 Apolipoprotein N-acyltransferase [Roseimaritima ulvae]